MTERATVYNVVQIGPESTAGTAVATTKILKTIDIQPGIKASAKGFRPMGQKFAAMMNVSGKNWTESKINCEEMSYGEIVYLLSSLLKNVTASADGTLPKLWTYAPALAAEDTVKTYTVEVGSSVRAAEFAYGLVTDLTFDISREQAKCSGTMLGHGYTDGITMTAGNTAIETTLTPILPSQFSVYIGSSWANLSAAAALTRAFSVNLQIANRHSPLWVVNQANASFAGHAELPPQVTLKLLLAADSTGMGPLTNLAAGTTTWIRIKAEGAEIESGKPYLFQIDGAYGVTAASDFKDEQGVYAVEWTLEPVYDATATKTIEVQVRNLQASL